MDIRDLPVFVYTIPKNIERQKNVKSILKYFGFKRYTLIMGRTGMPEYWQNIHDDFINILQKEPPFLFLEDDIEPNYFNPIINPPNDAQLVYLGGTKNGELFNTYKKDLRVSQKASGEGTNFSMVYKDMEGDWVRPYNMHSTHAVLFLDKATNYDMIKHIYNTRTLAVDVVFAKNMWRYNTYLLKKPIFFQNDKLNHQMTTNYYEEKE